MRAGALFGDHNLVKNILEEMDRRDRRIKEVLPSLMKKNQVFENQHERNHFNTDVTYEAPITLPLSRAVTVLHNLENPRTPSDINALVNLQRHLSSGNLPAFSHFFSTCNYTHNHVSHQSNPSLPSYYYTQKQYNILDSLSIHHLKPSSNTNLLSTREIGRGACALHHAVERNHVEIILLLLKYGANTELVRTDGYCPLHVAAELGCVEATALLVEGGAYVGRLRSG